MTYSLDVEAFIGEVAKHREIWDFNSEDNRHKSKKQRAWALIARVIIEDFDDMTDSERLDVYKKLHSKWRNIRDSYVRDLKRKEGKRGYMYASQLAFLQNLYNGVGQSGSEDSQESEESPKRKRLAGKSRRYVMLNDTWASDGENSLEENRTIETVKRKRRRDKNKTDKIEFVESSNPESSRIYPIEDEDRSFFESLLPVVREFDVDQKLEFRSEVISLIKQMRSRGRKIKTDPSEP